MQDQHRICRRQHVLADRAGWQAELGQQDDSEKFRRVLRT